MKVLENNQLIKLDGVLYKIKRFFNSIFRINKTEKVIEKPTSSPVRATSNVLFVKEKLAKKLKTGEIDVYDLSDEEVDEMLEHFEKSIESKDKELEKIKLNILRMKTQIFGKKRLYDLFLLINIKILW